MNELYEAIGKRIAELRHENQFTQSELAEKLDISVKHLSEVERGIASLSLEKLIALCEILSTDLDYLVQGIDHRCEDTKNIPPYVLQMFNSDDENQKKLFQEYVRLFKKIYSNH